MKTPYKPANNQHINTNPKYQKGEGMFPVIVFTLLVSAVLFVGVKVGPSFLEYKRIVGAMDEVAVASNAFTRAPSKLIQDIDNTLRGDLKWIDLDLNKVVSIIKRGERKYLELNYEVEIPIVLNLSALMHYEHNAKIISYAK